MYLVSAQHIFKFEYFFETGQRRGINSKPLGGTLTLLGSLCDIVDPLSCVILPTYFSLDAPKYVQDIRRLVAWLLHPPVKCDLSNKIH